MKHSYGTACKLLWKQLHSGLKTVGQRVKHITDSKDGFSLVEAIVSVVILGLAVVPISMVFTQTVHQTIDTRRQLEANELAQSYVEALKSRPFEDYNILFAGGVSNTFDETTSMGLYQLTEVPKDYQVKIYMETDIDLEAYKLPLPKDAEPVDAIVTLKTNTDRTLNLANGNNLTMRTASTDSATYDRKIEIDAKRASNTVTIAYFEGNTLIITYDFPLSKNALRFVMGETSGGSAYDIDININSNITSELKLNFYEGVDENVTATTSVESGFVSISRNLKTVDSYTHRIVELRVEIYDTITGNLLTSLTGTKIDE